jgi:hypothetical protein
MAKYSDIKGFTVQTLSTDTIASQAAGGSWASGTSVNTARSYLGSAGIKTALLVFGGSEPSFSNKTESWNGSSWTELNELNTARSAMASGGTYTAAFSAGGRISTPDSTAVSEEWNGTSWAEGNDLNLERYSLALGAGSQTAGLALGGNKRFSPSPSPSYTNDAEEYNGTSWTEVTNMPTGLEGQGANGTQTATAVFGGYNGSLVSTGILYDGTNWTSTTSLPTAASTFSSSGSQTEGLLFGLATPSVASNTLSFDGTAFTELNDLSTARTGGGGPTNAAGTDASAILAAGFTTTYVAVTEEWTAPAVFNQLTEGQLYFNSTTNTFKETVKDPTAGTWASSGGLNENRALSGGSGVQTAAIYFGGPEPSYGGKTETYNGSSFTEVADLNTGRVYGMPSGHGTTTATICFGGEHPIRALTESWDGSSWTEVGDLNLARYGGLGAGTATAAIAATGYATGQSPVYRTECELYDGSSWTEVNNNNTARYVGCGFGLQTTAVYAGGNVPPNNTSPAVESWDGTSWTEIAELNTARQQAGSAGATGTDGLVYGGRSGPSGPDLASTEYWNGSSWTETNDMATARGLNAQQQGMSPLASLAVNATPPSPASEEFTSAGLANKTITAS